MISPIVLALYIPAAAAQSALGALSPSGRTFRCSATDPSCLNAAQILREPFKYQFPKLENVASPSLFPMKKCRGLTLEEATIDQLQDAMSKGLLTSKDLVMCYLHRIYQVNEYIRFVANPFPFLNIFHIEGGLGCLLELNPDFLAIAEALDEERAAGISRGPLHGIPFLVKDNIASKDKMQTTAGSWALLGSVVPRDAFVVKKLRQAGAVLLGKAALSEWADMRSNNYSEGFSVRGGQARSPYNLTVNPGGSSSGSAAAVAANAISFALGTETDGSVINPAERNALVGIKPTVGLTSRAGVVPESIHQDTVGTFGRTVRDATYAFDAIYGVDERDNYTLAQIGRTPDGGYTQFLTNKLALKEAIFGLPWKSFWVHADTQQLTVLNETLRLIQQAGGTIINGTELPDYKTIVSPDGWNWDYGTTRGFPNESEYTVVKVDFYNNIKTYLSELQNTEMKSLEDIVRYNLANDGTEGGNAWPRGIPAFYSGQDGFDASLKTKGVMDRTYWEALGFVHRTTREGGIDAALRHNGRSLSALLVPPDVGQTYQIAAQAGYPMVTLPAGNHAESGMPFGLALMGTAWSEAELLKWASAIEDLQFSEGRPENRRTLPNWLGYMERNIPVLNVS